MKKHTFFLMLLTTLVIGGALFSDVVSVHAQSTADKYFDADLLKGTGLPSNSTTENILAIVRSVLQTIGLIDLILVIYAGFLMILAGSNPEKFRQGKNILFWAVVGTIVILSSLGIVEFIDSFV